MGFSYSQTSRNATGAVTLDGKIIAAIHSSALSEILHQQASLKPGSAAIIYETSTSQVLGVSWKDGPPLDYRDEGGSHVHNLSTLPGNAQVRAVIDSVTPAVLLDPRLLATSSQQRVFPVNGTNYYGYVNSVLVDSSINGANEVEPVFMYGGADGSLGSSFSYRILVVTPDDAQEPTGTPSLATPNDKSGNGNAPSSEKRVVSAASTTVILEGASQMNIVKVDGAAPAPPAQGAQQPQRQGFAQGTTFPFSNTQIIAAPRPTSKKGSASDDPSFFHLLHYFLGTEVDPVLRGVRIGFSGVSVDVLPHLHYDPLTGDFLGAVNAGAASLTFIQPALNPTGTGQSIDYDIVNSSFLYESCTVSFATTSTAAFHYLPSLDMLPLSTLHLTGTTVAVQGGNWRMAGCSYCFLFHVPVAEAKDASLLAVAGSAHVELGNSDAIEAIAVKVRRLSSQSTVSVRASRIIVSSQRVSMLCVVTDQVRENSAVEVFNSAVLLHSRENVRVVSVYGQMKQGGLISVAQDTTIVVATTQSPMRTTSSTLPIATTPPNVIFIEVRKTIADSFVRLQDSNCSIAGPASQGVLFTPQQFNRNSTFSFVNLNIDFDAEKVFDKGSGKPTAIMNAPEFSLSNFFTTPITTFFAVLWFSGSCQDGGIGAYRGTWRLNAGAGSENGLPAASARDVNRSAVLLQRFVETSTILGTKVLVLEVSIEVIGGAATGFAFPKLDEGAVVTFRDSNVSVRASELPAVAAPVVVGNGSTAVRNDTTVAGNSIAVALSVDGKISASSAVRVHGGAWWSAFARKAVRNLIPPPSGAYYVTLFLFSCSVIESEILISGGFSGAVDVGAGRTEHLRAIGLYFAPLPAIDASRRSMGRVAQYYNAKFTLESMRIEVAAAQPVTAIRFDLRLLIPPTLPSKIVHGTVLVESTRIVIGSGCDLFTASRDSEAIGVAFYGSVGGSLEEGGEGDAGTISCANYSLLHQNSLPVGSSFSPSGTLGTRFEIPENATVLRNTSIHFLGEGENSTTVSATATTPSIYTRSRVDKSTGIAFYDVILEGEGSAIATMRSPSSSSKLRVQADAQNISRGFLFSNFHALNGSSATLEDLHLTVGTKPFPWYGGTLLGMGAAVGVSIERCFSLESNASFAIFNGGSHVTVGDAELTQDSSALLVSLQGPATMWTPLASAPNPVLPNVFSLSGDATFRIGSGRGGGHYEQQQQQHLQEQVADDDATGMLLKIQGERALSAAQFLLCLFVLTDNSTFAIGGLVPQHQQQQATKQPLLHHERGDQILIVPTAETARIRAIHTLSKGNVNFTPSPTQRSILAGSATFSAHRVSIVTHSPATHQFNTQSQPPRGIILTYLLLQGDARLELSFVNASMKSTLDRNAIVLTTSHVEFFGNSTFAVSDCRLLAMMDTEKPGYKPKTATSEIVLLLFRSTFHNFSTVHFAKNNITSSGQGIAIVDNPTDDATSSPSFLTRLRITNNVLMTASNHIWVRSFQGLLTGENNRIVVDSNTFFQIPFAAELYISPVLMEANNEFPSMIRFQETVLGKNSTVLITNNHAAGILSSFGLQQARIRHQGLHLANVSLNNDAHFIVSNSTLRRIVIDGLKMDQSYISFAHLSVNDRDGFLNVSNTEGMAASRLMNLVAFYDVQVTTFVPFASIYTRPLPWVLAPTTTPNSSSANESIDGDLIQEDATIDPAKVGFRGIHLLFSRVRLQQGRNSTLRIAAASFAVFDECEFYGMGLGASTRWELQVQLLMGSSTLVELGENTLENVKILPIAVSGFKETGNEVPVQIYLNTTANSPFNVAPSVTQHLYVNETAPFPQSAIRRRFLSSPAQNISNWNPIYKGLARELLGRYHQQLLLTMQRLRSVEEKGAAAGGLSAFAASLQGTEAKAGTLAGRLSTVPDPSTQPLDCSYPCLFLNPQVCFAAPTFCVFNQTEGTCRNRCAENATNAPQSPSSSGPTIVARTDAPASPSPMPTAVVPKTEPPLCPATVPLPQIRVSQTSATSLAEFRDQGHAIVSVELLVAATAAFTSGAGGPEEDPPLPLNTKPPSPPSTTNSNDNTEDNAGGYFYSFVPSVFHERGIRGVVSTSVGTVDMNGDRWAVLHQGDNASGTDNARGEGGRGGDGRLNLLNFTLLLAPLRRDEVSTRNDLTVFVELRRNAVRLMKRGASTDDAPTVVHCRSPFVPEDAALGETALDLRTSFAFAGTGPPPALKSVSPQTVRDIENVAVATATVSSVISNPVVAVQQARVSAVLSLSACEFDHSEPVDGFVAPLGWKQGSKLGSYYRGALVGNAVIFEYVLVLSAGLMLLVYNPPDGIGVAEAAGIFHLPGVLVVPIAVLCQGTVSVATSLYNHGKGPYDRALTLSTAVAMILLWAVMLYYTTWGFRCRTTKREAVSDPNLSRLQQFLVWMFYSDTKWEDLPPPKKKVIVADENGGQTTTIVASGKPVKFKTYWQQLFFEYRDSYQWFFVAEMLLAMFTGVLEGIKHPEYCRPILFLFLALITIQALAAIFMRPFTAPFNTFFHILVSVGTWISTLLVVIATEHKRPRLAESAGIVALTISTVCSVKLVCDILQLLRWFHSRHLHARQRRADREAHRRRRAQERALKEAERLRKLAEAGLFDFEEEEDEVEHAEEESRRLEKPLQPKSNNGKGVKTQDQADDAEDIEMESIVSGELHQKKKKNKKREHTTAAHEGDEEGKSEDGEEKEETTTLADIFFDAFDKCFGKYSWSNSLFQIENDLAVSTNGSAQQDFFSKRRHFKYYLHITDPQLQRGLLIDDEQEWQGVGRENKTAAAAAATQPSNNNTSRTNRGGGYEGAVGRLDSTSLFGSDDGGRKQESSVYFGRETGAEL